MTSGYTDPARAAHWYAANHGWRVFPVHGLDAAGRCTCGKHPCGSPGKHPRTARGCLDATTNHDTIAAWWEAWPDAGVAIATGRGLVVIDVDPRHGGDDGLVDLRRSLGALPDTAECITGGGGLHLYLSVPEGVDVRNSAGALAPGVDLRGDGGYVLAPPSRHASGRRYLWEASGDPDEIDPAPAPDAWLAAMTSTASTGRSSRARAPDEPIVEGGRNEALTRRAGSLRAAGFGIEAMTAALLAENAARCVPPLAEREVRAIAGSVHRYAPTHRAPGATLDATTECADAATRDRAYRAVLAALTLDAADRDELVARGFTDPEVTGYRSLPAGGRARLASAIVAAVGEDLARRVPGVWRAEEHGRAWWSLAGRAGLVVPVRDAEGLVVALDVAGHTLSSAHRGGPAGAPSAHVPDAARAMLERGAPRAVLVVGAMRADLATARLSVPCLGASRVTTWRACLALAQRWRVPRVAVVFDGADARAATIAHETRAARDAVREAGIKGELAQWGACGFDGYLAARGAAAGAA